MPDNFIKIVLLFIVCLTASVSIAQQLAKETPEKYSVVNWNTEQGFPSKYTTCMLKDVLGFLWIGTKTGLTRFDGSTFKNYFPGIGRTRTIPGGNIIALTEDSLHNIWIGTDNGISRYNLKADSFTNFLPVINSGNTNTYILPFWSTKDEVLCVEADSIFTAYNIHSLLKRIVVALPQKIGDNRRIPLSVFDAKTNSVWMTPSGGPLLAESGLFQVPLSTGEPVFYDWHCYKNISHHFHFTEGMCYDMKRNSIWMNTEDGLIEFTLDDRQFHFTNAVQNLHNRGVGICMDTKDRVWVGTDTKGVFIFDPFSWSATVLFSNDTVLKETVNWSNYRIYCDRDGMVWIGYWTQFGKGVNQLIPVSPTVIQYPLNTAQPNSFSLSRVYSVIKADDRLLWISGDNAINIFNPTTGLFSSIEKKNIKGIEKNKEVQFLGVDGNAEKAWLCVTHPDSLYEMDIATLNCRSMKTKDNFSNRIDLDLINEQTARPFKKGYIFLGESHGKMPGVFALNKDSAFAYQLFALGDERISDIATDGEQMLFLRVDGSVTNLTYSLMNEQWIQTHSPMDSVPWIGILYNKADRTWWVGSFMQLIHYDKNFRLIKRYTIEDGVPDIQVYSMLADESGNIWFLGSSGYISQLNLKTGIITSLSEKDGFQKFPNYPVYRCNKDDGGDLYFYGYNGIDRIKPDKYIFTPASVYFKSLEIKQFSLPLSTGINNVEQLSLKYFQNKINIETGAIDYYSKDKSHIRYKLVADRKNAEWQYAPANYSIRYEELPPGEYRLHVQAGNAGNEFNGAEKILLFKISPPFWVTLWFRILAIGFGLICIFVFEHYRAKSLHSKNILLEKKVLDRTSELNKSLVELKTTQDQLIQSEKMASLGELTSGIAHEIKNPLNFINNFSEINLELLTEIIEEQSASTDTSVATAFTVDIEDVKNLRKNSEKINHHGKRVDSIVRGMLQHSRQGNVVKEPINLNTLCEESLKLASHSFKAKENTFNASFETQFALDLPAFVGSAQDIGRVILNIINNAFYAVHEKEKKFQNESPSERLEAEYPYHPTVLVTTKNQDHKLSITISDNGMGIPRQIISKIFQPFFTTKPTGEGTGLGLSMAYDIITKGHAGELNVKSKEGVGTDFEIILHVTK